MKNLLLLTTSLICVQLTTYAQLRYGLAGGLQSSKVHLSALGLSINTNGMFGAHVGGVAEYAVSDNFFIRPELLLSFKGGTFKNGIDSYKLNLTYLELPIQGIYKYEIGSGKLVGGIGPYFGFLLGGKDDDEPIVVGTDIKGLDAGLRFLGGYELTEKNLGINLFYNMGLANINPDSGAKIRNSTIGVSVTYFFGER